MRSKCKECGGSGICEHGRVRSQCKECGGSGICEHGRVRSKCKEEVCMRYKKDCRRLAAPFLKAHRSTQPGLTQPNPAPPSKRSHQSDDSDEDTELHMAVAISRSLVEEEQQQGHTSEAAGSSTLHASAADNQFSGGGDQAGGKCCRRVAVLHLLGGSSWRLVRPTGRCPAKWRLGLRRMLRRDLPL